MAGINENFFFLFFFQKYVSLGIQSPCQMMIGVYDHLQNARYLASITILKR